MRACLLSLVLVFFAAAAGAQEWSTVRRGDTSYFVAGPHLGMSWSWSDMDTGLLRGICIREARALGADSLFVFPTGIRDTAMSHSGQFGPCLDTAAPSWLGPAMLRAADGTERYLNRRGDTIRIRTGARLGDSWELVRTGSGLHFIGTIVSTAATSIDGVPDSIKTLQIQAFSTAGPVSHWYNGMVLEWSKHHGWVRTLDFYQFPETVAGWDYGGLGFDSTQHLRLPGPLAGRHPGDVDLEWVYQPGNEWIADREAGFKTSPGAPQYTSRTITHDSVISVALLGRDTALVQLKRTRYQAYTTPVSSSVSSQVVTDTVLRRPAGSHGLEVLFSGNIRDQLNDRYFWKPFCSDRMVVSVHGMRGSGRLDSSGGCLRITPGVSGKREGYGRELLGFGSIESYFFEGDSPDYAYSSKGAMRYLKLGACISGTKFSVAKLDAAGLQVTGPDVTVSPNPADGQLRIRCSAARQLSVRLCDVLGRTVLTRSSPEESIEIRTTDLPSGVYLLQVSTPGSTHTERVVVRH